jgi:RNA polymerase sigma-70 factor (ECF subfamily)
MLAKKIFPVCLWYAKNREEAEDIMQEGFLKVFKYLHQYNSSGSFEGWVRKIIVRTAIDKVKNNRRLYAIVNNDDAAALVEDSYAAAEILEKINIKTLIEMIQSLPPMYRLVFNLYAFENLKHREIAEQLGITEGTSKSNLSDARKILQEKINSSLNYEIKQTI